MKCSSGSASALISEGMTMARQMIAIVLCAALVTSGCASASGPRTAVAPAAPVVKQEVLADYAQRLPAGSHVKVETSSGGVVRGTLLKADAQELTLQGNTRILEPPVDLAAGARSPAQPAHSGTPGRCRGRHDRAHHAGRTARHVDREGDRHRGRLRRG